MQTMVVTRGKDDEKAICDLLGNKDYRKKFEIQFRKAESNFQNNYHSSRHKS